MTVRYFGDAAARSFIAAHFERAVVDAYDALLPGAFKSDLFRYCVLFECGGIYSDLKQRLMRPLDDLVDRTEDGLVLVRDRDRTSVQISFMTARPKLQVS